MFVIWCRCVYKGQGVEVVVLSGQEHCVGLGEGGRIGVGGLLWGCDLAGSAVAVAMS